MKNQPIDTDSTQCYTHRSESIIYKSQTTRSRWTRWCCRDLNARLRGGEIVYTWGLRNNGYTTVQDRLAEFFQDKYCLRKYTRVYNLCCIYYNSTKVQREFLLFFYFYYIFLKPKKVFDVLLLSLFLLFSACHLKNFFYLWVYIILRVIK